jgi:small-conductance mechanosensitive channel
MDRILERLQQYYVALLHLLPRMALAILIFVVGFILARWLSGLIRGRIRHHSHDPLMSSFLGNAIKLMLIIIVFMLALHTAGLSGIAGALLATAGASALIVGFAFKDIAENFLAGIILAFNRPFNVNDTVKVEDVFGKVQSMEFRYTKIRTFDGRNVYIPNADVLKKPVYNYTEDGFIRTDFIIGISYEDDIEKAKHIIEKTLEQDPTIVHDDTHINFVAEEELAASTVNLKVYFWVETDDFRRGMLQVRGGVMQKIKTALESSGMNLPADITELKFYDASNPFRLKTAPSRNGDQQEP